MIDNNRRTLFKVAATIAAGTAAGGIPAMAWATNIASGAQAPDTQVRNTQAPKGTALELDFLPTTNSNTQIISIKNTTSAPVTLRHVYPGIVHSDGHAFDINDVLSASSIKINAGQSHCLTIQAVAFNSTEKPMPAGSTITNTLKVSTRVLKIHGEQPVITTRSFLA